MPSRASIARLDAPGDGERQVFSFVPAGAFTPSSSPPWPGSIAIVRIERRRVSALRSGGIGRGGAGGADRAARRRSVAAAGDDVDDQPRRRVERLTRRLERSRSADRDRTAIVVASGEADVAWISALRRTLGRQRRGRCSDVEQRRRRT